MRGVGWRPGPQRSLATRGAVQRCAASVVAARSRGPAGAGVLSQVEANICSRMAHAPHLREKARVLRAQRKLTIDELAERLALSRSTVYYWVRDMPIPGSGSGGGWPESARRKGNLAMQRKYRLMREDAYREGLETFDELAREASFRDFVCLYIAEGSKRERNSVGICSSDPAVLERGRQWRCRYGVLTVRAHDTALRQRMQAWMHLLRASWR